MATNDLVTFLFTDIEGSTRLWEEDSAAMQLALAEHDAQIDLLIAANDGEVFKHAGDGVLATFSRPLDAIQAAVGAQLALTSDDWPAAVRLKVRMAIHTGEAEQRHSDWFGPALNRTARMLDAAHGGQVLVSTSAATLARDLPPPTALRSIGEHRFRDLSKPETVHQVAHPELRFEFPPLRSLESYATNLPIQLTPFIGREGLVSDLATTLQSTRLLTLTGVGGVGKSRLATQLAADALERFPNGVWLVELAALADPGNVPGALSRVLGLHDEPGRSVTDTVVGHLRTATSLIIFDNCEHVIDSVARLAEELLTTCPDLRLIATSREGLGIGGETLRQVPPLDVPTSSTPVDAAADYDSVALFLERAKTVQPDLAVPPTTLEDIIDICRRLDGIALAIELAAARIRVLSIQQIAERLDDRFRLLTGGSRTALPRQRTLQATMDWSHDLLRPSEKLLFRRLAAFHGGFDLAAAEAVCEGPDLERGDVLELVSRLVEESLLITETTDPIRYRMLETVRQYAEDRLAESGEAQHLRAQHASWVARIADDAEVGLRGSEQEVWVNRLRAERDNIRAALTWCRDSGKYELGLRIAGGLGRFWWLYEPGSEGLDWITDMLEHTPDEPSAERAEAYRWAAVVAWATGDLDRADSLAQSAKDVAIAADAPLVQGHAVMASGFVSDSRGDVEAAVQAYRTALAAYEEIDERYWASIAMTNLEGALRRMGEPELAQELAESLLAKAKEQGDTRLAGLAHSALAINALHRGNVDDFRRNVGDALSELKNVGQQLWHAQTALRAAFTAVVTGFESLADEMINSPAFTRLAGVPEMEADFQLVRGLAALYRGDNRTAEEHFQGALDSYASQQASEATADVRLLLARVALAEGRLEAVHDVTTRVAEAAEAMGSTLLRMAAHNIKAVAYLASGDHPSATQLARSAAGLAYQAHRVSQLLQAAETLAEVAIYEGDRPMAATLLRSAEHHRKRLNLVRTPSEQERFDRAQAALGKDLATGRLCKDLAELATCCVEPAPVG